MWGNSSRGRGVRQRLACLASGIFERQPGCLALHDRFTRKRLFGVVRVFVQEFFDVEILIRQCVGELMHKRFIAHALRGPVRDKELLPVEIVKCRGLFGEQIDSGLPKIEIRRNETKFLQAEFLGVNILRANRVFDLVFDVNVDLVARDELERQLVVNLKTSDIGKPVKNGVDLGSVRKSHARLCRRLRGGRGLCCNHGKSGQKQNADNDCVPSQCAAHISWYRTGTCGPCRSRYNKYFTSNRESEISPWPKSRSTKLKTWAAARSALRNRPARRRNSARHA